MKKFYKQPFLHKRLIHNDQWIQKLLVVIAALIFVLVPFFVCWIIYHVEPGGLCIKYKMFICYNACPQTWQGNVRLYFRSHCLILWIISTCIVAVVGIAGAFIVIDNKLLLFSFVVAVVSLLTNFVNYLADSRGALDYWTLPTSKVPMAFFGLEAVVLKINTGPDHYSIINWPDITFALSSDLLVISFVYVITKHIVIKCKKRSNLKKIIQTNLLINYKVI